MGGNALPALHTSGRNKLHERRSVKLLAGGFIPALSVHGIWRSGLHSAELK